LSSATSDWCSHTWTFTRVRIFAPAKTSATALSRSVKIRTGCRLEETHQRHSVAMAVAPAAVATANTRVLTDRRPRNQTPATPPRSKPVSALQTPVATGSAGGWRRPYFLRVVITDGDLHQDRCWCTRGQARQMRGLGIDGLPRQPSPARRDCHPRCCGLSGEQRRPPSQTRSRSGRPRSTQRDHQVPSRLALHRGAVSPGPRRSAATISGSRFPILGTRSTQIEPVPPEDAHRPDHHDSNSPL